MAKKSLYKSIRVFILLLLLIGVALGSWLTSQRSTSWEKPLWIAIYPINADNSRISQQYINQLSIEDFKSIETFIEEEAKEFQLTLSHPFEVKLAPQVNSLPPSPPISGATWEIMLWSLQLRYWAYQADTFEGPAAHIRIFVKFHDSQDNQALAHSLGLEKGMLGIVNAFASRKMSNSNTVVITHEILHTLGASDKYDLSTGQPLYPIGYAEKERTPRYPQELAEIMGGKIPLNEKHSRIPKSLNEVIIGNKTAREIHWQK